MGTAYTVDPTSLSLVPQWRESIRSCLPDVFNSCSDVRVLCEAYWKTVKITHCLSNKYNLDLPIKEPLLSLMFNLIDFRALNSQRKYFREKLERLLWILMIHCCVQQNGRSLFGSFKINSNWLIRTNSKMVSNVFELLKQKLSSSSNGMRIKNSFFIDQYLFNILFYNTGHSVKKN